MYKGNAHSECQGLAGLWSGLAKVAGIKKCGCVSSDKMDHMWNWLEVDGKKYYFGCNVLGKLLAALRESKGNMPYELPADFHLFGKPVLGL